MSGTPLEKGARSKGRLEAFSDGVFAIAITLLVIEIAVPERAGGGLLSALFHERPVFLAYFIAFMSIGIVWIEHSALTEALERVNAGFLRLNLLLLLLVAFLPFPARVMEAYLSMVDTESGGERTAVAFFGIILFLMSLMLIVLGKYAEREGLFGAGAGEERAEDNRVKYQLAPEPHLLRDSDCRRAHLAVLRGGPVSVHRRLPAPAGEDGQAHARPRELNRGRALRRLDRSTTLSGHGGV